MMEPLEQIIEQIRKIWKGILGRFSLRISGEKSLGIQFCNGLLRVMAGGNFRFICAEIPGKFPKASARQGFFDEHFEEFLPMFWNFSRIHTRINHGTCFGAPLRVRHKNPSSILLGIPSRSTQSDFTRISSGNPVWDLSWDFSKMLLKIHFGILSGFNLGFFFHLLKSLIFSRISLGVSYGISSESFPGFWKECFRRFH